MAVTDQDFDFVRLLVCEQAGIVLETGKQYLVEARLMPLAKRHGLPSITALLDGVRGRRDEGLRQEVVEAMTTNETTFFRDVEPFEALRKYVVPSLLQTRAATREIRFWYGASSTGQEPYSVVMLLAEHFPELASWNVQHVATDINLDVLARARGARYTQSEINRGLPATYLVKYFEKRGLEWHLKPAIRERVRFEPLNLVKPWPALGTFDVVMLRNVMIYFDVPSKREILRGIRRVLRQDGYFFLGGAESTLGLDDHFRRMPYERAGCYCLGEVSGTAQRGAA